MTDVFGVISHRTTQRTSHVFLLLPHAYSSPGRFAVGSRLLPAVSVVALIVAVRDSLTQLPRETGRVCQRSNTLLRTTMVTILFAVLYVCKYDVSRKS